ncbi:hypothetical protein [Candidatus Albibeggiatoa sp. nov. NOAA]|uniref:nSTAND1 domain-containing NTPase n=1 Tax=Candidatus Albibeggiatoa sp. nov. NOAA TaxID=3162724 RepID=UPI0032F9B3EF|nr:hypothetical protein [Thiotrichaceae bacterium]
MSEMPYVGLRPFDQTENDIFFGREEHIYQLLDIISNQHFVTIVGSSGCGKSSLINAGLIPSIQMGLLPTLGVFWRIVQTTPGNDPFGNLATALLHDENAIKKEYEALLKDKGFGHDEIYNSLKNNLISDYKLQDTIENLNIKPKTTNILLIVDQFEEIFKFRKQSKGENEELSNIILANKFVNFLLQTSEELSNVYVLISMRSEFIGECSKFYDLAEKVNDTLFLVPRLTRLQLQNAIEKPIQIYQGTIASDLVQQILNDADNEPDQLPLIQHLLLGIWHEICYDGYDEGDIVSYYFINIDSKKGFTLYKEYGGIKNSLSKHIDKVYRQDLDDKQEQIIAKYLFISLVEIDDALPNTRRIAKLGNVFEKAKPIIEKKLKNIIDFKDIIRVTNKFRIKGRRFIGPRIEIEELNEETKVFIAHESLIRQWGRLHDWKKTEEYYLKLYRLLEENFELWNKNNKSNTELLHGALLVQAEEWIEEELPSTITVKRYSKKDIDVNELIKFIEKSRFLIQQEHINRQEELRNRVKLFKQQAVLFKTQAELAEHNVKLEKENIQNKLLSTKKLRIALVFSLILLITTIIFFIELSKTYKNLEVSEQERTQFLFDSRITQAVSQIQNSQFNLSNVALSENFALLDEASSISAISQHTNKLMQGYVHLFSQLTSNKAFKDFDSEIYSLIPVNNGFIIGGKTGKWGLLNTETGSFILYPKLNGKVYAVTNYPAKNWLITGDASGQIIVWDQGQNRVGEPTKIKGAITALVTMNDVVIAGDSRGFIHYGAVTEKGLHRLLSIFTPLAHKSLISQDGLTLNQDKTKLLTASHDKAAKLWELDVNGKPTEITAIKEDSKIYKAIFNADDTLIATANADSSISLFNIQGQKQASFRGHQNKVFALQFSSDNRYLISGSQDNDIIVWDVESGKPLQTLESHEATVSNLILEDRTLWSSSIDGQVKRWQIDLPYNLVETCKETCPAQFNLLDINRPHRKHPLSVAVSPQGKYVVIGFLDGTLRLYNLDNMQIVQEVKAHQQRIRNIKFNKKGNLIAIASFDKQISIWELDGKNLQHKQSFQADKAVYDITFSPNSEKLAAVCLDGKTNIYTFNQPILEDSLPLYKKHGLCANFIDENQLIVAGDSRTYLLNLDSGDKEKLHEAKEASLTFGAIYSSVNHYFATYGQEGKLNIFNEHKKLVQSFIAHNNTIYKAQFSLDGNQIATLSSDGTLKVWDIGAKTNHLLFSIDLPIPNNVSLPRGVSSPVYDFDFRCTPTGCWMVIPMIHGRIAVYNFGKEIYKND